MRKFINILAEGRVLNLDIPKYRDRDVKVFHNPSRQQQNAFEGKPIRAIVDRNHDLYVWDGMEATHDDVEDTLGLSGDFYIYCGENLEISSVAGRGADNFRNSEWLGYPSVTRFWGPKPPITYFLQNRYQLTESVSSAYSWEWVRQSPVLSIAQFTTDTRKFFVNISGTYTLSLSFEDSERGQGITGLGDAQRVFATVLDILIPYLRDRSPEAFAFEARHNQPSRIKLYTTMSKRLASVFPQYNLDIDHDGSKEVTFTFRKEALTSSR